jgi:hypothetical protein
MGTEKSVENGFKFSDDQLGKLSRKFREIERRIRMGAIDFETTLEGLQKIIIEGQSPLFLQVVDGIADIKLADGFINCNVDPYCPSDWRVDSHTFDGIIKFSPDKVHLGLRRTHGVDSEGWSTFIHDKDFMQYMNATVLDYLLKHPDRIPEEWKKYKVYFLGTVYASTDGLLFVRYLYYDNGAWSWGLTRFNSESEDFLAASFD